MSCCFLVTWTIVPLGWNWHSVLADLYVQVLRNLQSEPETFHNPQVEDSANENITSLF
jgi:hypothetical protein